MQDRTKKPNCQQLLALKGTQSAYTLSMQLTQIQTLWVDETQKKKKINHVMRGTSTLKAQSNVSTGCGYFTTNGSIRSIFMQDIKNSISNSELCQLLHPIVRICGYM